jgi:hypothetical protein
MNTEPKPDHRSFRFRIGKGARLTDEIASIEALATERLRAGVSYHSVQTDALALLKLALDRVTSELVEVPLEPTRIQACTPPPGPPRCAAPEG